MGRYAGISEPETESVAHHLQVGRSELEVRALFSRGDSEVVNLSLLLDLHKLDTKFLSGQPATGSELRLPVRPLALTVARDRRAAAACGHGGSSSAPV